MQDFQKYMKTLPLGFIDPPPLGAPKEHWRRFLSDMQKWPQDNEPVQRAIAKAKGVLSGEIKPQKIVPYNRGTPLKIDLTGILPTRPSSTPSAPQTAVLPQQQK